MIKKHLIFIILILLTLLTACKSNLKSEPLITHIYTADPSVHIFENKLYIYPSHDIETDAPETNEGDHFNMKDYHVFSLKKINGEVTDHGVILSLDKIPWAKKQLWAPDAAFKNNIYYFYFPAKDKDGIFRIGAATSNFPYGPFTPMPEPISGSYSIDPCVFIDDDNKAYMYFGGLWGGQIEKWRTGKYDPDGKEPHNMKQALGPRVAEMTDNMIGFKEPSREIIILNEKGKTIIAGDHKRRFFEGAWMHKYNGLYYLSYSTGDTHLIVYGVGDSPLGPFTFKGIILDPVIGWTTHHSIIEFKKKWYLFYHDSSLSNGKTHLRSVKVKELFYNSDGTIQKIIP